MAVREEYYYVLPNKDETDYVNTYNLPYKDYGLSGSIFSNGFLDIDYAIFGISEDDPDRESKLAEILLRFN